VTNLSPGDISIGALTLLRECVGGRAGERLLIVSEPRGNNFYDEDTPALAAQAGRALGMTVYETELGSTVESPEDTDSLMQTLQGFDHVVFFSRVGDQIRFSDNKKMPPATMCYTLNRDSLNSAFGTACYHGLCEIKNMIDSAFHNARHIRVTCPRGTNYEGCPVWTQGANDEVTLKRFPMLIPKPVPMQGFSGRIAMSQFLLGTGSRFYEPYCLPLQEVVTACVVGSRISHFEGDPAEIKRVEEHYKHVAGQFGIEPWVVHSWHAGMHPGCGFENDATLDLLRWSASAFGNPRLLHFHTCGDYAPGEISLHVVDPTIYLDDIPVWEDGCLYPQRLTGSSDVLERHPNLVALFNDPYREIGLAIDKNYAG